MTALAAPVLTQPGPTKSHAAMTRIPTQHWRKEPINCDPCSAARRDASQVRDDSVVTDLVAGARNGDKQAWDALVERYAPLIWSICRRHRLSGADADDVGQSVWLRLVDQLDKIRDPAALPGWLATTTRRECRRVLRTTRDPHPAGYPPDIQNMPDEQDVTAEQELLAAEAHAALRGGQQPADPRPAADRRADPRPAPSLRRDQRQAGHPGRQHRAEPRPLPGQAAPLPGRRRPDQRG